MHPLVIWAGILALVFGGMVVYTNHEFPEYKHVWGENETQNITYIGDYIGDDLNLSGNETHAIQPIPCDNFLTHWSITRPLGEFLCYVEHTITSTLAGAGYDPAHVYFYSLLTLLFLLGMAWIIIQSAPAGWKPVIMIGLIILVLIMLKVI